MISHNPFLISSKSQKYMLLKKGQIISLWAYLAQFECSATGAYGIVDTMTLSNVIRLLISVARATIAQE